jgi:alpha-1,2-mannosyltransferase
MLRRHGSGKTSSGCSAATGGFCLSAIYRILRRHSALVLALAPSVVVAENILLGRTGFLTAGVLGWALASMKRMPFRAGVLLGLLAYKPQLGLLLPVVLVIAGPGLEGTDLR